MYVRLNYLAMPIRVVLDDAAGGAFSAFHERGVDVLFDFVDGDVDDGPAVGAQLLAVSDKVDLSGWHHWTQHL